jgi:hypothetical protein
MSTSTKTPTASGISRLLSAAGFKRSTWGGKGVMWNEASTGFSCWKSYNQNTPQQPYVAAQHVIAGSPPYIDDEDRSEHYREMRARLEDYAKVLREAGYAALVRDRGAEPPWLTILTVVAPTPVSSSPTTRED